MFRQMEMPEGEISARSWCGDGDRERRRCIDAVDGVLGGVIGSAGNTVDKTL